MGIFSSPTDFTDLHRYQESRDIYLLKKRFNSIGLELNLFFMKQTQKNLCKSMKSMKSV